MNTDDHNLFLFWAKTTHDKEHWPHAYHPLLCHMIDVAVVTLMMWEGVLPKAAKKHIAHALGLATDKVGLELAGKIVAWIAGLHDLGKASPPFILRKSAAQLHKLYDDKAPVFGLKSFHATFRHYKVPNANESPHGYVTAATLPMILREFGISEKLAKCLAELIGGHHGIFADIQKLNSLGRSLKNSGPEAGTMEWQNARRELAVRLAKLLSVGPSDLLALPDSALDHGTTMIIAGLVSVADWIGSNASYFRCKVKDAYKVKWWKIRPERYWQKSNIKARKALLELGWLDWPQPESSSEFDALFPELAKYSKRPAQQAAIHQIAPQLNKPGLVIVEAPMGDGKTEAAVYLADQWNVKLEQRGIYFALPTMATSNQMFGRICNFLTDRFPGRNIPVMLQHGHAEITADFKELRQNKGKALAIKNSYCDDLQNDKCEGSLIAADWFTHRKRGLLVPFGVGTVDQVLMAALRTRHVFVRLFGLAHRTIIIDEIHAYDAYMSALLERLLEWLGALESPVVMLSATLPSNKRCALLNAYARGLTGDRERSDPLPEVPYPRITWTTGEEPQACSLCISSNTKEKISRQLLVEWTDGGLPENGEDFPLGEKLLQALTAGGCAAVICNTVDRAQQMYERLADYFRQSACEGLPAPEIDLFHARYLFDDRERREKLALWRFGKQDKTVDFGDGDVRTTERPYRFVLVATQVIEQSLDLDFDLMVSDFAPIDLLLQRSGRIWRHVGNKRYGIGQPTLWVCQPTIHDEVPRFDEGTEAVYSPDVSSPLQNREDKSIVPYVLLRSWLALKKLKNTNGIDDSCTISIPDDIESMIEETYSEQLCPDDLPESVHSVWQLSEQIYRASIALQEDKAETKRLPPPYYKTRFLGDFFTHMLEEDAPQLHQSHQALTRLGDSIGIICLDGGDSFDPKADPNLEETERLLRRSVTVARKGVVQRLRQEPVPRAWKKSPLLRHYRLVFLDQPVAGYRFSLHNELGLRIEKAGKEKL